MLKQESNGYLKKILSPVDLGYSFCVFMIDSVPRIQDTFDLLKNMLIFIRCFPYLCLESLSALF